MFDSSRPPSVRPQEGGLTAASLIDAIITHQISQTTPEPPVSRDGHRPSIVCIALNACIFYEIHN